MRQPLSIWTRTLKVLRFIFTFNVSNEHSSSFVCFYFDVHLLNMWPLLHWATLFNRPLTTTFPSMQTVFLTQSHPFVLDFCLTHNFMYTLHIQSHWNFKGSRTKLFRILCLTQLTLKCRAQQRVDALQSLPYSNTFSSSFSQKALSLP